MDSNSKAHDEYSILAENLRHYENLFFANLAAFLTINGGLMGLVFALSSPLPPGLLPWVRGAGVFLVVAFGGHCEIYLQRWYRLATRAIELEVTELPYKQYQRISPPKVPKLGGWLWRALFVLVFIFWCFAPLTQPTRGDEKPKASLPSSTGTTSTNTP